MAECRGLAPLARRHALVSTEARPACPVDIPNGPRGRTCTRNLSGLSGTPLHWATRGGAPGQICTDTVRGLSPLPLHWATGAAGAGPPRLVAREGFAPSTFPF